LCALEVAARVVSIVAIVSKADTGTTIVSVASVDALLECSNVVLHDDVVALVIQTT